MTSEAPSAATGGLVLFAYDGSELAGVAIEEAARQLPPGREAIVLCVWQPADVGFLPVGGRHLHAMDAGEVRAAAEETAEYGASLAVRAGFRAHALAVEAAPAWEGIISAADERRAGLIVLGSRRHSGLIGHLLGSVSSAVLDHAGCCVLIVHTR